VNISHDFQDFDEKKPFVWFASFQDIMGKSSTGGIKERFEAAHLLDWDCIVLDEAFLTFTKRSSISALQNTIITLLTMIRSRNLFIIVVCPVIFDMKPYLVVHRALAAFRCYHHGLERGYWGLYDEEAKAKLYYKGIRDGYNVHAVKPVYYGRFLSWLPVDKAEYEERKQAAINQLLDRQPKDEPTPETVKKQLESELRAVNFFRRNHWLKAGALKAFYTNKNISERYFYELLTAQGLPPKGSDLQTGDSSSLTFERSAEDSPKEPPKSFKQRLDGDDVGGWPHGDY
jgi:hypothetical protein